MTSKQRAARLKTWLVTEGLNPSQFAAGINIAAGQMVVQDGTARKWLRGSRPHLGTLLFIKNAYPNCPLAQESRL